MTGLDDAGTADPVTAVLRPTPMRLLVSMAVPASYSQLVLARSDIITRGDPRLTEPSKTVFWPDPQLHEEIVRLHDTLTEFQSRHGYGRAIAAPQIGILKRVVAMNWAPGR